MNERKILVYKTDLSTVSRYLVAKWMLDRHPDVVSWSLDQNDSDNVLRIVGSTKLNEHRVTAYIRSAGHYCEPLL